jgi:hypothetical protein
MLLLVLCQPASADGINLAWGPGCWRDNPTSLLSFACDTNAGSATMTASFAIDRQGRTSGLEARLDLQSDSPIVPDWWQLASWGGCRGSSLSASTDFSSAPGGCADLWQGLTVSTYVLYVTAQVPGPFLPPTAPNRVWLKAAFRAHLDRDVQARTEYYAFHLAVDFAKTAGLGACAGCSTPLTVVFNDLVGELGGRITTPLDNTCLRWQAGGVTPCSATPVQNPTWGQLKGLYR